MQNKATNTLSGLLLSTLCIASSIAAEANHNAATYESSDSCSQAISSSISDKHTGILESDKITLLSWNIEKGQNSGWKDELESLTEEVQLVLLQEAVFIDEMKESRNEAVYWSFSPGYKTSRYNSGIMTLSRVQPDLICSLQKPEPWLQTPKIASITRFQLHQHDQPLLLVNMHQINFSLGMVAFSQQLEEVAEVLKSHKGPIIFSGDFNTWRQARLSFLNEMMSELELVPASFSPDHRKTMFGFHLDHIFTRGFDIIESRTVQVETSDHNPLIITLSLKKV